MFQIDFVLAAVLERLGSTGGTDRARELPTRDGESWSFDDLFGLEGLAGCFWCGFLKCVRWLTAGMGGTRATTSASVHLLVEHSTGIHGKQEVTTATEFEKNLHRYEMTASSR